MRSILVNNNQSLSSIELCYRFGGCSSLVTDLRTILITILFTLNRKIKKKGVLEEYHREKGTLLLQESIGRAGGFVTDVRFWSASRISINNNPENRACCYQDGDQDNRQRRSITSFETSKEATVSSQKLIQAVGSTGSWRQMQDCCERKKR